MGWTEDRIATLRKLWAEGLSAREIAKALGGFEHCRDGGRNAVIGKIHRVVLPTRNTPPRRPRAAPRIVVARPRSRPSKPRSPITGSFKRLPMPKTKPQALALPANDPSYLIAAALLAKAGAAERRRDALRNSGFAR